MRIKFNLPALIITILLIGKLRGDEDGSQTCCSQDQCCSTNWYDGFYLQAEALYWRASEDNLSFAIKEFDIIEKDSMGNVQNTSESQKREELNFKWKPGVRVTVDYIFPCTQWDLDLVWTQCINNTSKSVFAPDLSVPQGRGVTVGSATILNSTWLPSNNFFGTVNKIHAHWHVIFDNFEWTFGGTIGIADSRFSIRPYIGPKYTRIKQEYRFSYLRHLDPNGFIIGEGTAHQRLTSLFSGFGLQGGFDADWSLGCGFCIYSNVSGGITYGSVHVRERESVNSVTSDSNEPLSDKVSRKDSTTVSRPNIDFALGLEWDYNFSGCRNLILKAGWEYHQYFDQNFFRMVLDNDPARGSLAFHGATLGAGFRF